MKNRGEADEIEAAVNVKTKVKFMPPERGGDKLVSGALLTIYDDRFIPQSKSISWERKFCLPGK